MPSAAYYSPQRAAQTRNPDVIERILRNIDRRCRRNLMCHRCRPERTTLEATMLSWLMAQLRRRFAIFRRPAGSQAIVAPTPAPRELARSPSPPQRLPPEHHAAALLHWLHEERISGCYRQLRAQHRRMVVAYGWAPRHWNPIGRELTKLLGGRKTYLRVIDRDNRVHRRRVFIIPHATPLGTGAEIPTNPGISI